MKIKLSKKQWEFIGKKANWNQNDPTFKHKISNCCLAPDQMTKPDPGMTGNWYSDIEMCPKCKEPCKFIYEDQIPPETLANIAKSELSKEIKLSQTSNWQNNMEGPTDPGNEVGKWDSGWLKGDWKCPKCQTIISRNLRGQTPFLLVQQHKGKCNGTPPPPKPKSPQQLFQNFKW